MADIRQTPQLDDFQGADENPLSRGGNWAEIDSVNQTDQLILEGGAARGHPSFVARYWADYWTPLVLTGDSEIWGEVDETLSNFDWIGQGWLTNCPGVDAEHNGYISYIRTGGGNNASEIYRYDDWPNGVLLGQDIRAAFVVAGTLMLSRIEGTHIKSFASTDGGANWFSLVDVVDNTYRTGFSIHLSITGVFGNAIGWTGYGGGYPQTPTNVRLPYLGVGP